MRRMYHPKFLGTVKDGKVVFNRRSIFNGYIQQFEGREIQITISKKSNNITNNQLSYLFACVYQPLAASVGYSIEELDGVLKKKHLTINPDTNREYVKNKTDLNRAELSDYIDMCRVSAAKCGVITPEPDKSWKEKQKEKK